MKTEWLNAIYGGALIGISASLMLLFVGRVVGISGIIYGLLNQNTKNDSLWRLSFISGLFVGGLILSSQNPAFFSAAMSNGQWPLIVAGLLVGFGTVLGSGCTSGHGVCGVSRLSPRSLFATLTFVAVGIVAVKLFKLIGIVQ
jgi:uncharacterized membrane protein YedE/YeeE